MSNSFSEWLESNYNKEELLGDVQELRLNNCVYADNDEFERGEWSTWDEYIDEVAGASFGYSEIFEELIDVYKEQGGEVIDNLSSLYCDFIDFLTLI